MKTHARVLWVLCGILLCGTILRAVYFAEALEDPTFRYPDVDAAYHDYWARMIIGVKEPPPYGYPDPRIDSTPYFRPPGYSYFLALIYFVAGTNYAAAAIVQFCLSLIACVLVYLIGRKWVGNAEGLVACALTATYWVFIYYCKLLLEPVLLTTLSLLLLYCLGQWTERFSNRLAFVSGIVAGLAALVRPNILLFAAAAPLWAFWISRRRKNPRASGIPSLVFILGIAITIAPATLRNWFRAHDLVAISSNAGINLYIGNNASANGLCADRIAALGSFRTSFEYPKLVDRLGAALGRPIKHSEASEWFTRQAVDFALSNPSRSAQLLLRKLLLFWGPNEVSHNKEDEYERGASAVLRHMPLTFPVALALALVGAGIFWKRERIISPEIGRRQEVFVLLVLFIVIFSASYLPFFIAGRYRAPIVPPLLLIGAYGICRVAYSLRDRKIREASIAIAGAAFLYLIVNANVTGYKPDAAKWRYGRGVAYDRAQKKAEAAAEYAAALSIRPELSDAHGAVGVLLAKAGRLDEAIRYMEESLRLDPGSARFHSNLGAAFAAKGELDNAISEYETALKIDPLLPETRINLGTAMARAGNGEAARAHFEEALRASPSNAAALFNMGLSFYDEQKYAAAGDFFRRAIDAAPAPAIAHYHLANTLLFTGKPLEAVEHYRSALSLEPGNAQWMNDLAWVLATHEDAKVRDAREAIRLAEAACASAGDRRPDYLDTLASAYAEAGRFDEAVQTERSAVRLLESAGAGDEAKDFRARLELFILHKPYRAPSERAPAP